MPNNLISSDLASDKIYIHSGITSTITDSFATPAAYSQGLTYDGANLISCDYGTDKIYVHSGITSTITDSFTTPGTPPGSVVSGLAHDGANLISCDRFSDRIYLHSGITSTITDSFASPFTGPAGLTYGGANLISCDDDADKIYVHSGITSTITDSFAWTGGAISGLTYDGTNLVSCDRGSPDLIFLHSGISSTITNSFAAPSSNPRGLAFEAAVNQAPSAPTSLLCEGQSSPVSGVSDLTPEFSAIFNDPDSGDIASVVQIYVGTTPGASDMWDSGWIDISGESLVEGNRCNDQSYAGSALSLDGSTYYWKIRFKDDDSAEGAWSANAQFTMQSAAPAPAPVIRQGLLSQIW